MAAALVVGFAVTRLGTLAATESAAVLAVAISVAAVSSSVVLLVTSRLASHDWFHPLAFPVAYTALSLFVPLLAVLGGQLRVNQGQGVRVIDPSTITLTLAAVFACTVIGLAVGAGAGVWLTPRASSTPSPVDYERLLSFGRALLVLALVFRVVELPSILAHPFGYQTVGDYSSVTFVRTQANGLVFIAMILIATANTQLNRRLLQSRDASLFLVFAFLTLLSGSRGELLAPALFALIAYHRFVRPIRLWRGLAAGMAVVVVFTYIGGTRTDSPVGVANSSSVARVLAPVSVPLFVTSDLVTRVPRHHAFTHGSTYWAAVKQQLPGPIVRTLVGPPSGTGTFVYRGLLGFKNPDAGLAFSFPSEGYLNFGVSGAFVAATVVGLLLGFAYNKLGDPPSRALHLLYMVMVAALPNALRTDAVGQIKSVLYPMLVVMIAFHFCRSRSESRQPAIVHAG